MWCPPTPAAWLFRPKDRIHTPRYSFADYLLSPEGQKMLEKFGLDSAVHKPDFKRWYPEQGKTVEQYEKENSKWEKLLREIGRK